MSTKWPPQRVVELVKTGDGDDDWYDEIAWFWTEQSQKMVELVQSIVTDGIKNPIDVHVSENGEFRMLDGHHRVAAALALSLGEIPVNFWTYREPDADSDEA